MNPLSAEEFFQPRLEQAGFTGLFWPKACSPAEQYGFPCDGCALFYRTERFEVVSPPRGESVALLSTAYYRSPMASARQNTL